MSFAEDIFTSGVLEGEFNPMFEAISKCEYDRMPLFESQCYLDRKITTARNTFQEGTKVRVTVRFKDNACGSLLFPTSVLRIKDSGDREFYSSVLTVHSVGAFYGDVVCYLPGQKSLRPRRIDPCCLVVVDGCEGEAIEYCDNDVGFFVGF